MKITLLSFIQKQHPVGRDLARQCSTKAELTKRTAIAVPLLALPKPLSVIPAQAGIHKAVQAVTADRFRLNATGMTGWAQGGMTRQPKAGRARAVKTGTMGGINMTAKQIMQQGFTLLEMILVLFLIGLMASTTLMLTEGVEDQAKYDATKLRMEMMRKAIIGDPTRTVNGGPEISGFVADMGRLPGCVKELLEPEECLTTNPIDDWEINVNTGVGSGWRGPYISVLPERSGQLRFRDGYGNSGTDASGANGSNLDAPNTFDDERYSGWTWRLYNSADVVTADASTAVSIRLQSYDLDGSNKYPSGDIETTDPIVARQLELVNSSDWQAVQIYINFINHNATQALPPNTSSQDLIMKVYLDDVANPYSGENSLIVASGAISALDTESYLFEFDTSNAIPTGTYSYAIICDDTDKFLFTGDCADVSGATPSLPNDLKFFNVAPRQDINLYWVIK